jgi:hypothetical protein
VLIPYYGAHATPLLITIAVVNDTRPCAYRAEIATLVAELQPERIPLVPAKQLHSGADVSGVAILPLPSPVLSAATFERRTPTLIPIKEVDVDGLFYFIPGWSERPILCEHRPLTLGKHPFPHGVIASPAA